MTNVSRCCHRIVAFVALLVAGLAALSIAAPTHTIHAQDPTATPTDTPTDVPTSTPSDTATWTPIPTPTDTPTATDVPTETPTDLPTLTETPSETPTYLPSPTETATLAEVTPELTETAVPSATEMAISDMWTTYADNDPALRYENGQWQTVVSPDAEGGTLTYTTDPDATLSILFEGTGVRLLYSVGPEGGSFTAYLDFETPQAVTNQAETSSYGHILAFENLPAGIHRLVIVNGSGPLWIEAVQIQGELLSPENGISGQVSSGTQTQATQTESFSTESALIYYENFEAPGIRWTLTGSTPNAGVMDAWFSEALYSRGALAYNTFSGGQLIRIQVNVTFAQSYNVLDYSFWMGRYIHWEEGTIPVIPYHRGRLRFYDADGQLLSDQVTCQYDATNPNATCPSYTLTPVENVRSVSFIHETIGLAAADVYDISLDDLALLLELPTPTPVPLKDRLISADFDPRRFDQVYVGNSDGTSTLTNVLLYPEATRDFVAELDALPIITPRNLLGAIKMWIVTVDGITDNSAFDRCNYQIPNQYYGDASFRAKAGYYIPEYEGWKPGQPMTNHTLWQLCVTHVSVLAFTKMTDAYSNEAATYENLLNALLWEEIGLFAIDNCALSFMYVSSPPNPDCNAVSDYPSTEWLWIWPAEAVARQLYEACGIDSCQSAVGNQFELYAFLSYYQPARNGTLASGFMEMTIIDSWPNSKEILKRSAASIIYPPPNGSWELPWTDGIELGRPFGFATDLAANDIWFNGRRLQPDEYLYPGITNSHGCNNERYAFSYVSGDWPQQQKDAGRRNIFFGTAKDPQNVGGIPDYCRFQDFYQGGAFPVPPAYFAK